MSIVTVRTGDDIARSYLGVCVRMEGWASLLFLFLSSSPRIYVRVRDVDMGGLIGEQKMLSGRRLKAYSG